LHPDPVRKEHMSLRHSRQAGFSLVEILVVIAIITFLMALLLPAIQKVRAAADSLRCKNNLRQIGIACHHYHNDYQTLPPGGIEWRPLGNTTKRQLAWCAYLLPYIEQDNISRRLDLQLAFDAPINAPAASQVITIYLCPSSRRMEKLVQGRGACDYGGIFGERIMSPNNPPKGVMIYDRAFRLTEIRDGSTHTLMISEDCGFLDGQWINGRNIFDQAFAINRAPSFENDIRSDHPQGANGLFADGSARFLPETMALPVLAAICSRAGGEVVSEE
jgi:prepilin-type N-terminal cleavage/methylation domain-containing protein/prepilin-type processing-associated H-X9-DG protein